MFGEKILEYWDDIMSDCKDMIAIPSVATDAVGEFPYGENASKAIDLAMSLCDKYDLQSKNVDYYACHAQIGEGDENAIVMAHLDVVPEGEGWTSDPYEMIVTDTHIIGRGIADDKGSAIVALHCLRALRDAGVVGKRKLRVVMGSGEEVGMDDMKYYFSKEQKPTIGFTPDSEYGVCNCEKGHLTFHTKYENNSDVVKSFQSGTVVNAVPSSAFAKIVCTKEELSILIEKAKDQDFEITETFDGAEILSRGQSAHASTPHLGKNSAGYLIELLYDVFGDRIGSSLLFAKEKIGTTYDGSAFGLKCRDDVSGELTLNLGIVKMDEEYSELFIDIRFPISKHCEDIIASIKYEISKTPLELVHIHGSDGIYMPSDSPLIQMLTSAYEDVTGEKCDVFAMGGGTYAKAMNSKGVAFGPSFQDDETHIHDCNERINLEKFKIHAQICLEAMYRIYTQEKI